MLSLNTSGSAEARAIIAATSVDVMLGSRTLGQCRYALSRTAGISAVTPMASAIPATTGLAEPVHRKSLNIVIDAFLRMAIFACPENQCGVIRWLRLKVGHMNIESSYSMRLATDRTGVIGAALKLIGSRAAACADRSYRIIWMALRATMIEATWSHRALNATPPAAYSLDGCSSIAKIRGSENSSTKPKIARLKIGWRGRADRFLSVWLSRTAEPISAQIGEFNSVRGRF